MRLFIGVDLPKEIKDYLYNLQGKIHSNLAKIKFVEKKNLHLSLKFIGDVEDSKVEEIKERLKKVKFSKLKVRLGDLGVFPDYDFIRVIWVGLKPEKEVIKLQETVDAELIDLFPSEQKFKSHLTLGRVKLVKKKPEFKNMLEDVKIEPLEFEINSFQLVKSELAREGPHYKVLEEYSTNILNP